MRTMIQKLLYLLDTLFYKNTQLKKSKHFKESHYRKFNSFTYNRTSKTFVGNQWDRKRKEKAKELADIDIDTEIKKKTHPFNKMFNCNSTGQWKSTQVNLQTTKRTWDLNPGKLFFNKVSSKFRIQIKQRVLTHTLEAHTAFRGQRQNSPWLQGQSAPQRELQDNQG